MVTLEGATKLFDNETDPYQMNNLLDQPAFEKLQKDLDAKLIAAFQKAGDDFKTRDHYLQKWNVSLDKSKKAINYWDFNKGTGVMQSPRLEWSNSF